MDVETDPLAVYVVIELGRRSLIHGPFASRDLAEKWAVRSCSFVFSVEKMHPVLDDAPAAPGASRG